MVEKQYEFSSTEEKVIEKIVDDENVVIAHVVLTKDTGVPEHHSNSNVYVIVIAGKTTIRLNDNEAKTYSEGSIIHIPTDTKMNIQNISDEKLEFFIVKAPNPAKN